MKTGLAKSLSLIVIFLVVFIALGGGCTSKKEEKRDKHQKRAEACIQKGELDKAAIELRNVIKLNPENDAILYELGEIYLKLQRGEEAFQAFTRAVQINPENMKAQLKMGQILLLGKRTAEAKEKADLILERSPDDIGALTLLSGIQLQEKDLDSAIKTLEKAVSLDSNKIEARLILARYYLRDGQNELAKTQIERALNQAPQDIKALMLQEKLKIIEKDLKRARDILNQVIRLSPDYSPAYIHLGILYNLARQQDEALKSFNEALGFARTAKEQLPESSGIMDTLGWIYYLKGSYLNAVAKLQDSLELEPNNPIINYHLGMAYYKNNKPDAAKVYLERALEMNQTFRGAEEARAASKNVENIK